MRANFPSGAVDGPCPREAGVTASIVMHDLGSEWIIDARLDLGRNLPNGILNAR
jgi:hypothetical protein